MKPEARVGLVVLLAALLLASLVTFLGRGLLRERGYEFTVVFDNAEGLAPGTPVRMAGVPIGAVRDLRLTPDHRAAVRVRVHTDAAIPSGSRFLITSGTLLGNRYLAVVPGPGPGTIGPGEQVPGDRAFALEDVYRRIDLLSQELRGALQEVRQVAREARGLVRSAGGLVEELTATVRGVQRTVADPRLARSLLRAAAHIEAAGASIERTGRSVEALASDTGADVRRTARNLRLLSDELLASAREVERFAAAVAAEGRTAAQIRSTVASIERTARRVEEMSRTLQEGLLNEEQVREVRGLIADARRTVRHVDEATERMSRGVGALAPILERIQQGTPLLPSLSFTYEISYDSRTMFRHDLDLWINREQTRYYRLGLHDIGRGNLLHLQAGFRLADNLGWRAGLIEGQLGVGLDYAISPAWELGLDLYNLNRLTLDLWTHYAGWTNWAVGVRVRDVLQNPSYGIGLRYRF